MSNPYRTPEGAACACELAGEVCMCDTATVDRTDPDMAPPWETPAAPTTKTYGCGDHDCAAREAAGTRCPWCWGGYPDTASGTWKVWGLVELADPPRWVLVADKLSWSDAVAVQEALPGYAETYVSEVGPDSPLFLGGRGMKA